MGLKTTQ